MLILRGGGGEMTRQHVIKTNQTSSSVFRIKNKVMMISKDKDIFYHNLLPSKIHKTSHIKRSQSKFEIKSTPSVNLEILNIKKGNLFSNANFPFNGQGKTYHLEIKKGDIANKILLVGSVTRAQTLSILLKPSLESDLLFSNVSSRMFITYTGLYKNTPMTIIATLMGIANMDFVIREILEVTEGPLSILRLGTCGAIQPPAELCNLIIASGGSTFIRRNPDAFDNINNDNENPYSFSKIVSSDKILSNLLLKEAQKRLGEDKVHEGINATADSFYSSQGRFSHNFDDRNENLLDDLIARYPNVLSLEMETFHLLDLARCSKGRISAAAAAVAIAERYTNKFIDIIDAEKLELEAGIACFEALSRFRPTSLLKIDDHDQNVADCKN